MKFSAQQIEQARVGIVDPHITRRQTYSVRVPGVGDLVFERKLFVLAGDTEHRWFEWVPQAESGE